MKMRLAGIFHDHGLGQWPDMTPALVSGAGNPCRSTRNTARTLRQAQGAVATDSG
jgi:hypothetical protein